MRTIRLPALLLGLLYLCFFFCLAAASSQLPERVATHFDVHGQPNGWMSRDSHLLFMAVFGLVFPWFVPAVLYASRLLPDRFCNLPHRDYWLAPTRRARTLAYLFRHSLWFASMALCFVIGIHFSIIHANSLAQVHLSAPAVLTLGGCFIAGTVVWGLNMICHLKHAV